MTGTTLMTILTIIAGILTAFFSALAVITISRDKRVDKFLRAIITRLKR